MKNRFSAFNRTQFQRGSQGPHQPFELRSQGNSFRGVEERSNDRAKDEITERGVQSPIGRNLPNEAGDTFPAVVRREVPVAESPSSQAGISRRLAKTAS